MVGNGAKVGIKPKPNPSAVNEFGALKKIGGIVLPVLGTRATLPVD